MHKSFEKSLTPRQQRFAERYAETLNGAKAAAEAGYSRKAANRESYRLLMNVDIQAAIREHRKRLADASFVEAVHVIRDLVAIAFADPIELTHLTRASCRHCHGLGHAYQWIDEAEFSKALVRHKREVSTFPQEAREAAMAGAPEFVGGFGFDPNKEPSGDCPRCRGEGVEVVWRADIKRLSGSSRKLYAGVKETRDGIQILMRDQDKALEMLGRHLGMFADKLQLQNDKENPIAVLIQQVQGSAIKPVQNPTENE
ncbi:MAG TPA: terminase small subunit [Acidisoma sp.]|jgi:phage terminase small subunit|uniref:terminase small subunit n=1 Tax=Acidisoma sp. TaxID=1872115 RepID=UPI002BA1C012|nr:terminase small subunit [Acidisoma sp.]HTH99550.1 terminase small subunit [Acidisoma sp.]